MDQTSPSLVIDANVAIAICARESDKYSIATDSLQSFASKGYRFYSPGVLVAEVLFVLCKKYHAGDLSLEQHCEAVDDLCKLMEVIEPPPNGDRRLVRRAESIRAKYGCSRSADGLYIALTELLTRHGTAVLLTFDSDMSKQAGRLETPVSAQLLKPV